MPVTVIVPFQALNRGWIYLVRAPLSHSLIVRPDCLIDEETSLKHQQVLMHMLITGFRNERKHLLPGWYEALCR